MTPEDRTSLTRATDESERKAIEDVQHFGLHILHVFDPDCEHADFSYTLGLWHSYQHPELIVFGLKSELRHSVLNAINERIAEGESFRQGASALGILEGFRCYFEAFPQEQFREHLGWDVWFYSGEEFETVQLIWPNTSGVFPWQATANEEFRQIQPIFSKHPLLLS